MKHVSDIYKKWSEYNAENAVVVCQGYFFFFGKYAEKFKNFIPAEDYFRERGGNNEWRTCGRTCGVEFRKTDRSDLVNAFAKYNEVVFLDADGHVIENDNETARKLALVLISLIAAAVIIGFLL